MMFPYVYRKCALHFLLKEIMLCVVLLPLLNG